jgi:hypothetical protein
MFVGIVKHAPRVEAPGRYFSNLPIKVQGEAHWEPIPRSTFCLPARGLYESKKFSGRGTVMSAPPPRLSSFHEMPSTSSDWTSRQPTLAGGSDDEAAL